MSEIIYKSTFDTSIPLPNASSDGTTSGSSAVPLLTESTEAADPWVATGNFASFICLVTNLEKKLRLESGSVFFDSESEVLGKLVTIGEGASFRVQKAEWKTKNSNEAKRWGKYVALKAVVPKKSKVAISKEDEVVTDWRDVLLEVRALLHEPLRWHPNIVRMIGFGWGPTGNSNTIYPQLVLEFSEIGTMEAFQMSNDALPFPVKQKLCYDVSRGLSILHACGIVHGDLTHRNVLIYPSRIETPGLPYTAKLSDFGGSVMDLQSRNRVRMTTWPYGAPELGNVLSSDEIRSTDVYSLGLFIWRTIIDCGSLLEAMGLSKEKTPATEVEVSRLKCCDELLLAAKKNIWAYSSNNHLKELAVVLIIYCLEHSIQSGSVERSLTKIQCALRGMALEDIPAFLEQIKEKNRHYEEERKSRAPGTHGVSQIGLLSFLGRSGNDVDLQENTPGYRPILSHPDAGEFQFEPHRLKDLLTWPQQQVIVKDLEHATTLIPSNASKDLQPWMAAFYLFQCYLTELGVLFDAQKACYWLSKAAEPESEGGVNYLAQAWLWRISNALNIACPASAPQQEFYIKWGIAHGHRTCIEDAKEIIKGSSNHDEKVKWEAICREGKWILNMMTGGVGMPWFAPRKLRRPYRLDDLTLLDSQIQEQLGSDYESSLRESSNMGAGQRNQKSIDQIYVNHVGHTLLHLAASLGNLTALRHLVQKYKLDINVKDQTSYEMPLVCACRCAHFDCAMFLIESGANPNSTEFGAESPLFWLSSFEGHQIQILAHKLVEAGAVVDRGTRPMRGDIRGIWADWEDSWSIPTTPLGRAVTMNSLPAVKVLLALGASPLAKPDRGESRDGRCALDLAAVLMLPDILEIFLAFLDNKPTEQAHIFDEQGMLQAAHDRSIIPVDTTTLQSRLRSLPEGSALCKEVRLGNMDIVESLLELGHGANGSLGCRPLEEAVKLNHEPIFRLLVNYGANINIRRSLHNGSQLSLLQISAIRPKSSRPGTFIAEYLINGGVPIEPLRDGSRSALALAVLNHNFELADLLLSRGANINTAYQVDTGSAWTTLIAELATNHIEMNVKSLEYLFKSGPTPAADSESATVAALANQIQSLSFGSQGPVHQRDSSSAKPSFIVVESLGLSVLHILALCPPDTMNDTAQISSRIIHTILDAYPSPEEINHVHPLYGTPLCAAAMTGNLHVVTALLDRKASRSLAAGPAIYESFCKNQLGPVVEPATPLGLAMSVIYKSYEAVLKTDSAQEAYDIALRLRNGLTVAMALLEGQSGDESGGCNVPVPTALEIRKMVEANEKNIKMGRARQIERLAGVGHAPVDLSGLKDRNV